MKTIMHLYLPDIPVWGPEAFRNLLPTDGFTYGFKGMTVDAAIRDGVLTLWDRLIRAMDDRIEPDPEFHGLPVECGKLEGGDCLSVTGVTCLRYRLPGAHGETMATLELGLIEGVAQRAVIRVGETDPVVTGSWKIGIDTFVGIGRKPSAKKGRPDGKRR